MRLIHRYLVLILLGLSIILPCIIVYTTLFTYNSNAKQLYLPKQTHIINRTQITKTNEKCRFYSCFNIFRCRLSENWKIKIFVYPYTDFQTVNGEKLKSRFSYEYEQIIEVLLGSDYITSNSSEACLFIPPLDLLSEHNIDLKMMTAALHSLPQYVRLHMKKVIHKMLTSKISWNGGRNHLLFNFFPLLPLPLSTSLTLPTGDAMVASSNLMLSNNRQGFDISVPLLNSLTLVDDSEEHSIAISITRKWPLLITQLSIDASHRATLRKLEDADDGVLMLRKCLGVTHDIVQHEQLCKDGLPFKYPAVLKDGRFCLILPGNYYGTTLLLDALMMGCIPVVAMDDYLLPFHDVIDWNRASVRIREYQLANVMHILNKLDDGEIKRKRYQGFFLWKTYFSSIEKVVMTTLKIFNERVFVNTKKTYEEWNGPFGSINGNKKVAGASSPLFYPLSPAKEEGFTAVILTYNRVDMLFLLMKELDKVPSLAKKRVDGTSQDVDVKNQMIIVWNNPHLKPDKSKTICDDPQGKSVFQDVDVKVQSNLSKYLILGIASEYVIGESDITKFLGNWPYLIKPWTLIKSKTNRLTNRFYPFKEIETEAVMAIDDDILMLTTDEIEFAYQTWREFPERLVGFPPRVHVTDPKEIINGKRLKYKYESEWQNELSMVLTGAAFYHKMYNHWFTYLLPFEIRHYIDDKMNCEDIGMNFLIANLTGKPSIKVTPRKRFTCAQCHGNDSLWSETSHFIKRSECLSVFTKHFGRMPLQPVEFRVDPALFQENIPLQMKAYPNLGAV